MHSGDPNHSSLITHHSSLSTPSDDPNPVSPIAEHLSRNTPSWLTPKRLNFYLGGYLLTQCLLFLFLQSTPGVLDRQGRVRGRDFLNFYVNGTIVARGEAERLYDPDYFLEVQQEFATVDNVIGRPRYYPVYPPTTALLFAPLAHLSYPTAILSWWLVLAGCFLGTGYCLFKEIEPAPAWRTTTLLALAAFTPVWNTLTNGQLAAVLLLVFYAALKLHQRNHGIWAGCLLSLLALKPQLAIGPVLWILFRLDWRALAGFCLGAVVQVGAATAVLGHQVLLDFVRKGTKNALEMARVDHITPDHQHSLAGVLTNLFGQEYTDVFTWVQLAVAAGAAWWLFRIVWGGPCLRPGLEYSALVIFTVFLTPHLLTYDLSLLLIPVAFLWSLGKAEGHLEEVKIGTGVYLSAIPTFLYYFAFSLVPAALLWALYRLAKRSPASGVRSHESGVSKEKTLPVDA